MPVRTFARTISQVLVAQGAAGATDLVAIPGAKLFIYVVQVVLTLDVAGTIKFTEGTGPTDLTGAMNLPAAGQLVLGLDDDQPVLQTLTANSKLSITTVTGKANGFIRYFVDGP